MARESLRVPVYASASRIFTKLQKISISIMRRTNIWIIVYLDDMLIMDQAMLMFRDTVIFFVLLKLEMSIMYPVQETEFLGSTF